MSALQPRPGPRHRDCPTSSSTRLYTHTFLFLKQGFIFQIGTRLILERQEAEKVRV